MTGACETPPPSTALMLDAPPTDVKDRFHSAELEYVATQPHHVGTLWSRSYEELTQERTTPAACRRVGRRDQARVCQRPVRGPGIAAFAVTGQPALGAGGRRGGRPRRPYWPLRR